MAVATLPAFTLDGAAGLCRRQYSVCSAGFFLGDRYHRGADQRGHLAGVGGAWRFDRYRRGRRRVSRHARTGQGPGLGIEHLYRRHRAGRVDVLLGR